MIPFKAKSNDEDRARVIPDIDSITQKLGIGRIELVTLAAKVSRSRNIKATAALELLGTGDLDLASIKEEIIDDLTTVKLKPVEEVVEEDDTPTLP